MPRTKGVLLTAAAICCATVLTGCSDDDTPSSVSSAASKAASAAESLGREATAAASSLASDFASDLATGAASALASATAEAGRELGEIKDGVDVKSDVGLGTPGTDKDGRATVEVTVSNTTDASKSFAVQIDFTDASGNRLDTVVTTVSDVAAGKTGKETAHSNRTLSGQVKAVVARAVRY
ncbi:outer membrane murein-binding lipoprotein Lpp [Streptomyces sp. 3330]|uniref:FxLYD domain-containing protein n=1 Tax=Streptomyces sp. 3330 TaxID=2817755 RepID=UPI00285E6F0F|nr:FxLYD domain-containing protein [Streptomyces sp. 3330]MDR6979776.1 outer membrane murein-binding lipoprotein Lpp [Streptomyces sp. 3330]